MVTGSPTAGESYTLECSAGGSEGIFQWLGPPDGMTSDVDSHSNVNTVSTATTSQLQFRPIQQSDNGSYTCNASAIIGGLALSSEPVVISVNGTMTSNTHYYVTLCLCVFTSAPSVSVQIGSIVATPTAGENYLLTCSVSGAENLNPTTIYRWTKNGGTQVGTSSNTLFFTPLRLTDAASYVCEVIISSVYLAGDIVAMNVNPQDVRIQSE